MSLMACTVVGATSRACTADEPRTNAEPRTITSMHALRELADKNDRERIYRLPSRPRAACGLATYYIAASVAHASGPSNSANCCPLSRAHDHISSEGDEQATSGEQP